MRALVLERRLPSVSGPTACLVAAAGAVSLGAGWLITFPWGVRFVLVGCAAALILAAGLVAPRSVLYGLVVWLAVLGLVRRVVSTSSQGSRLDPLLLVGPLALVFLVIVAARSGAFASMSALSKLVLALSALALLGCLNPLQGGIQTGLAGLLFMLVPMLAFWVGRGLVDDGSLSRLLKLVAAVAVGVAAYGLIQTFSHFPSWDEAWIRNSGYASLNVNGSLRPFGTLSSAQEYALFVAVGLGALFLFRSKLSRFPVLIAAGSVLAVAVFYASSRSVVVTLVLATGVALAARARLSALTGGIVAALLLAGVVLVASHYASGGSETSSTTAALASHQLDGLANPFNSNSSTLVGHLDLGGQGLRSALVYPLGIGTGSVSIAAGKFGRQAAGTELDPSNAAVALGVPGLIAYVGILVLGLSALAIVALFVIVVTLFQWLNGGLYAIAPLPWLLLGWVDRAGESNPGPGRHVPHAAIARSETTLQPRA
jgi:hypothetical protein